MNPFDLSLLALQAKAEMIREDIIRMLLSAGAGHCAGPLGMADIFTTLYFSVMSHDPVHPNWGGRDRLVLSCGHICPVLYATLAEAEYFDKEKLPGYMQFDSPLQGHPDRLQLQGLETSSGPLAQGISQAIGIALALRADHNPTHVYCIMSDGEHNEGQVWEALMFSSKMQLTNLTVIIDRNNIQIDGTTSTIMPLEPLHEKYESFGWHVMEVDGNCIRDLLTVFAARQLITDSKPVCIIAHTIPGKGVGFMENSYDWHGKAPNETQAYQALLELRTMGGKITYD